MNHTAPSAIVTPATNEAALAAIRIEIRNFLPQFHAAGQHCEQCDRTLGEMMFRLRETCRPGTFEREVRDLGENVRTAYRVVRKHRQMLGLPVPPACPKADTRSTACHGHDTVSGSGRVSDGSRRSAWDDTDDKVRDLGPEEFDPDEETAIAEYEREQEAQRQDDDDDESRGTDAGGGIPASASVAGGFGGAGASVVELPPRASAPTPAAPKGAGGAQLSLASLYEQRDAARVDLDAFMDRADLDLVEKHARLVQVRELLSHRSETCATGGAA